jgi:hypothetical protein
MILFPSLNIIWMRKLKYKNCAGLVERMGQTALHTRFVWGNLKISHHFEGLDVGGRIILVLNIYLEREKIR